MAKEKPVKTKLTKRQIQDAKDVKEAKAKANKKK